MKALSVDRNRIRAAWEGRISGCQLGKPLEALSVVEGRNSIVSYLEKNKALPLRDYVPLADNPLVQLLGSKSCKGYITCSEPDDDINYTVLALMMLEKYGFALSTIDVASSWLQLLPAAVTFTAERAAYRSLIERVDDMAFLGLPPDLDLTECANNEWSEWIGAQIRADLYGWVCPGRPELAADLARRDASLSHTGEGIHGATFIAALGAAIPATKSLQEAIDVAFTEVPENSGAAESVNFARSIVGQNDAVDQLQRKYEDLSPLHTLNNLALVVWGILSHQDDFSEAIGETVCAGWDTDCNGATVGGLWGLTGNPIPKHWTEPWQGRVQVSIAGVGDLRIEELVDRTVAVANRLSSTKNKQG